MAVAAFAGNRNFLGLLTANTVFGAALPMLLILSGVTGLFLTPSPALATLPASVQILGGLVAAAPFSLLMGRVGRRAGFWIGAALIIIGSLSAVQALSAGSFWLLCASHFLMGAAMASLHYFRFAAAEAVDARWQPVAISLMLTSGLIAAVGGPQIVIVAKDALAPIPFAGAYAALAAITLVGMVPLLWVHMPRPASQTAEAGSAFSLRAALSREPIRRSIGIAAVAQGMMTFLMIPTPAAMIGCGFSEDLASDVIRWHIVAMFAPSFVTGFLIQRFGAQTIAVVGLAIIILSAGIAALGLSEAHFYGSLIGVGIGWNFSFIGATAMLAAAVTEREKAALQGINDTLIGLVSTVFAFAAGLVISGLGWALLAVISIVIVVAALLLLALDRPQAASA